jgi:hypothetical protein
VRRGLLRSVQAGTDHTPRGPIQSFQPSWRAYASSKVSRLARSNSPSYSRRRDKRGSRRAEMFQPCAVYRRNELMDAWAAYCGRADVVVRWPSKNGADTTRRYAVPG